MNEILHSGWAYCQFEDVIDSMTNGVADKQNKDGKGFPVTRIETISSGKINLERIGFVISLPLEKREKYRMQIGDILFSHINSDIHLGKTAIFREADFELYHGCNLLRIRANRSITTPEFLDYICKSLRMNGTFGLNAQHAVNQSSLNQKKIKNLIIPLAPFREQKRITKKLDCLLAKVEACKTRLEKVPKIRNKLLIKFVDYSSSRIDHLGDYIEEGNDRIGTRWEGRQRVGVSNIEGIIPLRTGKKKTFENYKIVEPGDFIYNTMRVNIGSIAIYKGTENAITSPDYVVFRSKKELSSEFLLLFLKSKYGIQEINKNTKGSVRSRLYFKSLSNIEIPFSINYSQKLIESTLASFELCVEKLKIIRRILDKLSISILAKAFRGELVPQDPDDEPAELLLNRIRAEREALVANKKKGGRAAKNRNGREKKTKPQKADVETEPEPAAAVQLKTNVNEEKDRKVKSRKQPANQTDKRFEKIEVLKAFRKTIFHQNDLEEYTLLRHAGQRLGVRRLSESIRQELESYIRTAIRRKIISRNGAGYNPETPNINKYEDEYLIKVLRSVIRKGYEYERNYLVTQVAEYLGFDAVSHAFTEKMKKIFRRAFRRGELYRSGAYVGKP